MVFPKPDSPETCQKLAHGNFTKCKLTNNHDCEVRPALCNNLVSLLTVRQLVVSRSSTPGQTWLGRLAMPIPSDMLEAMKAEARCKGMAGENEVGPDGDRQRLVANRMRDSTSS